VKKDIRYVPSNSVVVEAMLNLASVTTEDTVFDLGSGDGRIPIAAARRGARGVGVDIDPSLIERSRAQGVDGAEFRCGSLFDADLSGATVVMLYLYHSVNLALRPKLLAELRPGSRVVSHSFDMGDWEPEAMFLVEGKFLYLWIIPPLAMISIDF
jgi:ribosomal protein L11 methylase PrmA